MNNNYFSILYLLLVGLLTGIPAYIMHKNDPSIDTPLFKALGIISIITLIPFLVILVVLIMWLILKNAF